MARGGRARIRSARGRSVLLAIALGVALLALGATPGGSFRGADRTPGSSAALGVLAGSSNATYPVTFEVKGLPNGTAWTVTAGGRSNGSTGGFAILSLPNGTHPYTAFAQGIGFLNGTLTVHGGPITVLLSWFAHGPAAPSPPAAGSSSSGGLATQPFALLTALAALAALGVAIIAATLSVARRRRRAEAEMSVEPRRAASAGPGSPAEPKTVENALDRDPLAHML